MPTREFLINKLTAQELLWFYDHDILTETLVDTTNFFSKGGFNSWTDEQLLDKYNRDLVEETNYV